MEKEIRIPKRITRSFIQSHPEYHFLFSYSVQATAKHGQSSQAYGEPNCSPIPVRYSLCNSSGYFSDSIKTIRGLIGDAITEAIIAAGSKPIIPFPRMGCGRSRMQEFAPSHWMWMNSMIDSIKYPNIVYV